MIPKGIDRLIEDEKNKQHHGATDTIANIRKQRKIKEENKIKKGV